MGAAAASSSFSLLINKAVEPFHHFQIFSVFTFFFFFFFYRNSNWKPPPLLQHTALNGSSSSSSSKEKIEHSIGYCFRQELSLALPCGEKGTK